MDFFDTILTGPRLEWMVASFFVAGLSTIVYNGLQQKLLGKAAPEKWTLLPMPYFFICWLYKDTAFFGVLIAVAYLCWKLSRVDRNKNKGGP